MKAMAVLFLLMGCMALFPYFENLMNPTAKGQEAVVAINYAIWRNAVLDHVLIVKPASGDIPLSALTLPPAWTPLRTWVARVTGDTCYAFGPASVSEISAVQELFHGSASIGRAESGQLVSMYGKRASVPGVPDGYLVSVIRID